MQEIDILGYLKDRQNELERVNHPLAGRSVGFRYLYAYGVAVLALGSMKSMTELSDRFHYFLECLALPKVQRDKLLVDINNHFEFRLDECLKILKTKEVQYCFLADLYRLSNLAVWSQEYCEKVIENYIQIFHLSEPEITFFEEFNALAVKQDVEGARILSRRFREGRFEISYRILQYFFPEYTDEDVYANLTVQAGKTLYLDKPTRIQGDIVVERGGSLLFDGAVVSINGSITVEGGRIRFRNTQLTVEKCSRAVFLVIHDAAVVRMEDSVFDCGYQCGFLEQDTGRLLVEGSEFLRARGRRMIVFSGTFAQFIRTSFSEGDAGFLLAKDSAQMKLCGCDFFQGTAEYGGAFFSDSVDTVILQECTFSMCRAKYLGAAVYFKYEKLGQVVKDCVYRKCEPEESTIFNTYEDDFELKIR